PRRGRHVPVRDRPADTQPAERRARREPARGRAPPRGDARRGRARRARLRDPGRCRAHGPAGPAAPADPAARSGARGVHGGRGRAGGARRRPGPAVSPTPRAALLLGAIALATLVVPVAVAAIAFAIAVGAIVLDALAVRRPPSLERDLPRLLSRGVPAPLRLELTTRTPGRARLRQASLPDVIVAPAESDGRLDALVTGRRRGRHVLPRPAVRLEGPLGLGCRHHRVGEDAEVLVYPDLVTAFRLAIAVRRGRFRDPGNLPRGPLGLGTESESVRDYIPDADARQLNCRATSRRGRTLSNQYRLERERDVVCVLDCGRLMAAPLGSLTRLDATVDAAT